MLSFIRYTFTKRVIIYAAIALALAVIVMLVLFMLGKQGWAYSLFVVVGAVWKVGITISWMRYKRYKNFNKPNNLLKV